MEQSQVNMDLIREIQQKILNHQEVTTEELRAGIQFLRQSRNAEPKTKVKAEKATKEPSAAAKDLKSLIDDLM